MAACNTQSCEACIDGAWGQWGQWSKCTASCDSGFRVRHRDAIQRPNSCGKPAIGLEDEYQVCEGLGPCTADTDCLLAEWGQWSDCSCSCYGVKERHRRIEQFAQGGGKSCGAVALEAYHSFRQVAGNGDFYSSHRVTTNGGFAALEEVSACNPLPGGRRGLKCSKACSVSLSYTFTYV